MSNLFTERVLNMTAVTPQPEDYTGEDGLLYCGKCHTPKEAYFPEKQAALFGRDRHPAECDCQRAEREEREAAEKQRSHLETVERLKRRGFTDPAMQGWTFENDNGENPADSHRPPLCGEMGTGIRGKLRLSVLGQRRHRKELPCGLYRKRPYGKRNSCLYDELCPYPQ